LAFDALGNLWVTDGGHNRVLEYSKPFSTGESASLVIGQAGFTSDFAATSSRGLNFPAGLSFDSSGNLWVVDSGNSRVLEFSGSLQSTTSISQTSSSVPEFPTQVVALVALVAMAAVAAVSRRFTLERRRI